MDLTPEYVKRKHSPVLFSRHNFHKLRVAAITLYPPNSFLQCWQAHRNIRPIFNTNSTNKTLYYRSTVGYLNSTAHGTSKPNVVEPVSVVRSLLQRFITTAVCSSRNMNRDVLSTEILDDDDDADNDGDVEYRFGVRSGEGQRKANALNESEVKRWLDQETGWDRLKIMLAVGPDGTFVQEDTRNLNTIYYRSFIVGAMMIMIKTMWTQENKSKEKHLNQSQALMKGIMNEHSAVKGIWADVFKSLIRFSIFSALLIHAPQAIAAYRNKSSVWEYTVCSSLAFGLNGLGQGMRQLAKTCFGGAVIGTLGGYVVCKMLRFHGLNQEQRHMDNIRHHLQEQKRWTEMQGMQG